jgi:protein transport protein SEC24
VQSGLLFTSINTIRSNLQHLVNSTPGALVSIITFDDTVHFYRFDPQDIQFPDQVCMPDVDDPFIPLAPHELLKPLSQFYAQIDGLLDRILSLYSMPTREHSCGGAALANSIELLEECGGQVLYFSGQVPTLGVGAFTSNQLSYRNTNMSDIESTRSPFYKQLAERCSPSSSSSSFSSSSSERRGVCVDVFCSATSNGTTDASNLSLVTTKSGGHLYQYSLAPNSIDLQQLSCDVWRVLTRFTARNCKAKIRASKGLEVAELFAPWGKNRDLYGGGFNVPALSADSNFIFTFTHMDQIHSKKAYVQFACLYTNAVGQGVIRVQTLGVPVANSISNMFRHTDVDVVTSLLMRQAALKMLRGQGHPRQSLVTSCVNMLLSYRTNCATTTAAGQLILPESLKMLPLFALTMLKMPALRTGTVKFDIRVASLVKMLAMQLPHSVTEMYPRIYSINPLPLNSGKPTGVENHFHLPTNISCSADKLEPDGAYLVQRGTKLFLWMFDHKNIPEDFCNDLWGIPWVPPTTDPLTLQFSDSDFSQRVQNMVSQLRFETPGVAEMPFRVVIANTPDESFVRNCLIEDENLGEASYVNFLCSLHREVQLKLEN